MKYLLTFDKETFVAITDFTVTEGHQELFQAPIRTGTIRYPRRPLDRFRFTAGKHNVGMEATVLTSDGDIYFLIIETIEAGSGPVVYEGFVVEKGRPDKKDVDKLFAEHAHGSGSV